MGCVSSKLNHTSFNAAQDSIHYASFVRPNHLVCLTSSTYGILNRARDIEEEVVADVASSKREEPPIETINAWELMAGLEDHTSSDENSSPKQKPLSPGKENHAPPVSKPLQDKNQDKENSGSNNNPARVKRRISHGPLTDLRIESSNYFESPVGLSTSSRCWSSPLFDPELLASFEASLDALSVDKSALKRRDPLEGFEAKCPPGGQDAVVLYTTTLRGIRKTFEDCNSVRSVVDSYGVWYSERDVSMHLGFRKEVENLMGGKGMVPVLFVKGRFVGGAPQVLELHEQGRLSELMEGVPRETRGRMCDGCGGVRFVPCLECSGSCKLLNECDAVVRCPECNENGLIQCPICC